VASELAYQQYHLGSKRHQLKWVFFAEILSNEILSNLVLWVFQQNKTANSSEQRIQYLAW